MTNIEAIERFQQAYGVKIDQLFWIAGSMDNSELEELMQGLEDKEYKRLFPDIVQDKYFKEYRKDDEELQLLVDHQKFGFIAEIHIPEAYAFKFKKGSKKPWGWGVHNNISKVRYAYGETIEELMLNIESEAKDCWNMDLKIGLTRK